MNSGIYEIRNGITKDFYIGSAKDGCYMINQTTLFAMCTFGGLEFTKLAVQSIRETVKNPYEIFVIVGKPGDTDTLDYLNQEGISYKVHTENLGFPVALNDIYDYAWKVEEAYNRYCLVEFNMSNCNLFREHDYGSFDRYTLEEFKNLPWLVKEFTYENLVLLGNDVILYDYAADSLIDLANSSDYKIISAFQYDVRDLIDEFPETSKYFKGEKLIINDFSGEPWKKFTNYSEESKIADMQLCDIQNLCLYKRDAFDIIGYTDVNFFPAYWVDNDYARRIELAGIKSCTLKNARFFHFWSRVFKQGSGGSTDYYFECNERYYKQKWGGEFGKETKTPNIKIFSRDNELKIVRKWRYYGEMRR